MNVDISNKQYPKLDIRINLKIHSKTKDSITSSWDGHDVSLLLRLFKKLRVKFFLFGGFDSFLSLIFLYDGPIRAKIYNFINNNVAEKYNLKFKLNEKDEEASVYEKYFITLSEFENIIDYFVNEVRHDNERKFLITDTEFSVVDENKEPKYWFEMGSDTPFQITVIDKINPEASREILIKALKELKKEIEEEQHKK